MGEVNRHDMMKDAFFELTGYGPWDVLAVNFDTRTFVTKNGGKYELTANLVKVRRLAGPPWRVEDREIAL